LQRTARLKVEWRRSGCEQRDCSAQRHDPGPYSLSFINALAWRMRSRSSSVASCS
jgi:hypothetical protein